MKNFILFILVCISFKSIACDVNFPKLKTCFDLAWNEGPYVSKYSSFNLIPLDNTAELSSLEPKIELWMPSMGHGSRPVKLTRLENKEYLVEQVFFMMKGQWEIRIKLLDKNNVVIEESKFSLSL